jgi:hypothetical protein
MSHLYDDYVVDTVLYRGMPVKISTDIVLKSTKPLRKEPYYPPRY